MAPDNERLGQSIGAAFDRLPDPVPARLKAIEDRLAAALPKGKTAPRTGGWYWWLIAALITSGAAAWWAGTLWQPAAEDRPTIPVEITEAAPATPRQRSESTEREKETSQKRSPTIYRRERP